MNKEPNQPELEPGTWYEVSDDVDTGQPIGWTLRRFSHAHNGVYYFEANGSTNLNVWNLINPVLPKICVTLSEIAEWQKCKVEQVKIVKA